MSDYRPQPPGYQPQPLPVPAQPPSAYPFQQMPPGYPPPAPYGAPGSTAISQTSVESAFISKVYGWMTLGLAISGAVGFALRDRVPANLGLFAILGAIGISIFLGARLNRLQAGTATALFVVYSAVMGLFMAVVFSYYATDAIFGAFFATAGMFAVMALVGWTTKRDLTKLGGFLFMALIGVILCWVVSIFWNFPGATVIIVYVGLLIFLGLTVYKVWQLKKIAPAAVAAGAAMERKLAIVGALSLYITFVNIFIRVLAIMGGGRRS